MGPKESGFNQSETASGYAHARPDGFQARIPWQEMVKLKQRQHFCHLGDTICHPNLGYVTTKLHGTSTCFCINNAIFSNKVTFKFPVVYVCRPR